MKHPLCELPIEPIYFSFLLDRLDNLIGEFRNVKWLRQITARTEPNQLNRVFDRPISSHDQDLNLGIIGLIARRTASPSIPGILRSSAPHRFSFLDDLQGLQTLFRHPRCGNAV
ncbi:MAG: hypothetical protein MCM46_16080 [Candidatus Manganitrophus sp. SB1]|nr:hypothetical protein [Candidatus Manganitrophus morganii]